MNGLLLLRGPWISFRTTNILKTSEKNIYNQNSQVSAYVLRAVIARKSQVLKKIHEKISAQVLDFPDLTSIVLYCSLKKRFYHFYLWGMACPTSHVFTSSSPPENLALVPSSIRPVLSIPYHTVSSTEFFHYCMPSPHLFIAPTTSLHTSFNTSFNLCNNPISTPSVICSSSARLLNGSTQGSSLNTSLFSCTIRSL